MLEQAESFSETGTAGEQREGCAKAVPTISTTMGSANVLGSDLGWRERHSLQTLVAGTYDISMRAAGAIIDAGFIWTGDRVIAPFAFHGRWGRFWGVGKLTRRELQAWMEREKIVVLTSPDKWDEQMRDLSKVVRNNVIVYLTHEEWSDLCGALNPAAVTLPSGLAKFRAASE